MRRRHFVVSVSCLAARPTWGQVPRDAAWRDWKAAYLRSDGRVVDEQNEGISHSEGQAYGLLLAQSWGDRAAFSLIENWTRMNLAKRDDALLAWKWQVPGIVDRRNATDGDLLRAWALLRASRDSGWREYTHKFGPICRALVASCLAPDPRSPREWLLKPAKHMRADLSGVIVNPSYYHLRALTELGEATGQLPLLRAAAHGERLLTDPNALRDWIDVTATGIGNAPNLSNYFGWDALRLPLYLFWSGHREHPALHIASARFTSATFKDHVATVTDPAGMPLAQSNAAGFRAVAALAKGLAPVPPRPGQGYYADTLALLAQIAWREGI